MTLKVIGAGFGRTGTESMKTALEILGLGPCHHMIEVLADPRQVEFWAKATVELSPDWEVPYQNYNSAVDWPTACYWRELSHYYPDAKFILTTRDPELWYQSFSNTILPMVKNADSSNPMGFNMMRNRVFKGKLEDKQHIIQVYKDHIEEVQCTLEASRLLTYQTGSGWEPLCRFLNTEVPDSPYPSTNQKEGFDEKINGIIDQNPQTRKILDVDRDTP